MHVHGFRSGTSDNGHSETKKDMHLSIKDTYLRPKCLQPCITEWLVPEGSTIITCVHMYNNYNHDR